MGGPSGNQTPNPALPYPWSTPDYYPDFYRDQTKTNDEVVISSYIYIYYLNMKLVVFL